MSDRDLIEAAAKAMGRTVTDWLPSAGPGLAGIGCDVARLDDGKFFQPLHENRLTDCMGDALRLAVRLRIDIRLFALQGTARRPHDPFASAMIDRDGLCLNESVDGDPDAATRLCIVRAATELAPKEPA